MNSALERALCSGVGAGGGAAQPESDSHGGVLYQGNKIETMALPEELEKVTRALRKLTYLLRVHPEMVLLRGLWTEIKQHQQSMVKIGGDALKASDIFYPCRFCKKLFK